MALKRRPAPYRRVTIGGRIKELRKNRGLSQQQLAAALGVEQSAISNWETGKDSPSQANTIALCSFFGMTMEYIRTGREPSPQVIKVPITGLVGADARIIMIEGRPIGWVDAPPDSNAAEIQAIEVRGDYNAPVYRDRDLVFVSKSLDTNLARYLGSDCIVELDGGDRVLAQLLAGATAGRYTVHFYGAADLTNQAVRSVAKILYLKRA